VISIVVPAHDEATVLARCLGALLAGAAPGEFEIVVVCNGCTDETATEARRFGAAVRVLEIAASSKIEALRAGDAVATGFPRFYVDADVVLGTAAVRAVARELTEPTPLAVAAPRAEVDLHDRPWAVRAFYRVWTSLPFFGDGFVGAGVYAFSAHGRARFGDFPRLVADDGFARLVGKPEERRTVAGAAFTFFPPRTLRALLGVMTRIRAGRLELHRTFPELLANETTRPARSLAFLLRRPDLWAPACAYLPLMLLAELRARWWLRARRNVPWGQDRSSRRPATPAAPGGLP